MAYTFDPVKNRINLERHGVDFAYATRIFDDTHIEWEDTRYHDGEIRFIVLGRIDERIYVVVNIGEMANGASYRQDERTAGNVMSSTATPKRPANETAGTVDTVRIDAMTDADIDRRIAADPDAAPDVSDWDVRNARIVRPGDRTES